MRNTTRSKLTAMMTAVVVLLAAVHARAGLIAHWKFDEGAGTTTADSSPNSNTATQAGSAGSWITGKAGGAYQLGGGSCRFELADSSALQVTGAVTVSAWVNPTAASNFGVVAGIDQTGGSANDMYSLKTSDSGSDRLRWDVIGPGTNVSLDSTSTLNGTLGGIGDGWVHVTGVYDPSGFAGLYVNGVLDASTASVPTAIQSPGTPFQIGHNASDSGSYPLRAAVDDIQVYDHALTADDVTFLYNNPGSALGDVDDTGEVVYIGDAASQGPTLTNGGGPRADTVGTLTYVSTLPSDMYAPTEDVTIKLTEVNFFADNTGDLTPFVALYDGNSNQLGSSYEVLIIGDTVPVGTPESLYNADFTVSGVNPELDLSVGDVLAAGWQQDGQIVYISNFGASGVAEYIANGNALPSSTHSPLTMNSQWAFDRTMQFNVGFEVMAAAEIPEPATLSLLGLGALFLRRRKR